MNETLCVRTAHSDYIIDQAAGTLCRQPREAEAQGLRGDGETVSLINIVTLEVGRMAEFMIQLPNTDAFTYRRTTGVESITAIDTDA